jgi:hypothetical protein
MTPSLKCVPFLLFASCVLGPAAPRAQTLSNSAVFNVTDYGAVADGKTLCTKAIQKTVVACAAAGGGTVYFPAGKYLSGAVFLKSNVTLHIGAGATLLASANFADFPPFKPSWAVRSGDTRLSSLITGLDLENIAVIGRGKLDGQGKPWWDAQRKDRQKKAGAPFVFVNCTDLELDGMKCRIPPANQPVIRLENSEKVFIRGCCAYAGTGDFLEVLGKATKGVFLIGNYLAAAQSQYVLGKGAQDGSVVVR